MSRLFPLVLALCLSGATLYPQEVTGPAQPAAPLAFRPADQISQSDRLLAADAESSIAQHARMNGFDLADGSWTTQQIACPALPNHLFLQYTRNNGNRDITAFSASIPRNGAGRLRFIPILKRGYSLFSPAPVNAMTISAFNHIRAEEGQQTLNGWLGNALCYAALAGARPQIAPPDAEPSLQKPVPAMTAQLEIDVHGADVIRFADAAATPHPMLWTMTFTRNGKLIKATHAPAPLYSVRPVPEDSPVVATRPVPAQN